MAPVDLVKVTCTAGTALPGGYVASQPLSSGVYGVVCVAKKDGTEFAVKVLTENLPAYIEMILLSNLDHPNIMKIHEIVVDESTNPKQFYIYQRLGTAEPPVGTDFYVVTMKLLGALAYLEKMRIIHCDIKHHNIVWFGQEPMLIDFGLAESCLGAERREWLWRPRGTTRFIAQPAVLRAPEMWLQLSKTPPSYDTKIDVYALSLTIFRYVTGGYLHMAFDFPTFKRESPRLMYRLQQAKTRYNIPDKLYNLLRLMLTNNPVMRPYASQLVSAPATPSPWIYPYPLPTSLIPLASDQRLPLFYQIGEGLMESGVIVETDSPNSQAWISGVYGLVEILLFNTKRRPVYDSSKYIKGGGGQPLEQDAILKAIRIAVALYTGFGYYIDNDPGALDYLYGYCYLSTKYRSFIDNLLPQPLLAPLDTPTIDKIARISTFMYSRDCPLLDKTQALARIG